MSYRLGCGQVSEREKERERERAQCVRVCVCVYVRGANGFPRPGIGECLVSPVVDVNERQGCV